MLHYAAFHLGLHYLPKFPFRGFQYAKGQKGFVTVKNGFQNFRTLSILTSGVVGMGSLAATLSGVING